MRSSAARGQEVITSACRLVAERVEVDGHAPTVAHHLATGDHARRARIVRRSPTSAAARGRCCAARTADRGGRARRGRPACRPRSNRSWSPLPIARAPPIVASASPSWAVRPNGSTARSRTRPTNSAAARRMSTASPAFSASQPSATSRAAGQQLAVPAGDGETLGQAQVRPRARGHRGVGAHHDVELVVVEMHGVRHQHVRAEHAQLVEMDERTATRSLRGSWRDRRRAATCGT